MKKENKTEFYKNYKDLSFSEYAKTCADLARELSNTYLLIQLNDLQGKVNKSLLKKARVLSLQVDKLNYFFRIKSLEVSKIPLIKK